jgi:pimeloyl-ACP methyl ester carboxylesterase
MQVTLGELTFDVTRTGDPDAPTVLLLHGFPQSAHCWRGVLPHLSGFHVLAPDQRGYSPGARPTDVEAYRVPRLVEDALGLLDELEVETAHVVGHDWGASVAWQLAARHPERVRTLSALSVPHPRAFMAALSVDPEQREKSLYMRDFARPDHDQVLLADDAAPLRQIFGGLPTVDVEHVVDRAREPGALAAWLRWYAAQRREDLADTPAVTVPTLHVWSDQDLALGRAATLGTAEWVTGPYRLEVLEGVSHWIPEQAAERLGPLLADHCA